MGHDLGAYFSQYPRMVEPPSLNPGSTTDHMPVWSADISGDRL